MDVPNPRGRAALLQKLREMTVTKPGAKEEEESKPKPPKSSGRAAMLNQLKEMREKALVGTPTAAPVPVIETPVTQQSITQQSITQQSVTPQPVKEICTFRGTAGKQIPVAANYIELEVDRNKGFFEYELRYSPELDSTKLRIKILNAHMDKLGGVKMFDGGTVLYLPIKLPESQTVIMANHPVDGSDVKLTIIYKRMRHMCECIHLFNVLFKRIMVALQYSRIGKNYFNVRSPFLIPQHRLEVLPGYALAVEEYEGGLMICLDSQHRVLRIDTALDLMMEAKLTARGQYKDRVQEGLIGRVVMTKYNNQTYVVHDILWDQTPQSTFETASGKNISFLQYYKLQYDITIKDEEQPLLLHVRKVRTNTAVGVKEQYVMLVPELCSLTGLTDDMRSNFKVMKEVAMYTRITPQQRVAAMRLYHKNVMECPNAKKILSDWGLTFKSANIDLNARVLNCETIVFGNNVQIQADAKGDFTRACPRNTVIAPVDIKRWAVIFTDKDYRMAGDFVENMRSLSNTLGMSISAPDMFRLTNDKTGTYVSKCQEVVNNGYQTIVFIFPTLRNDLYSSVKKVCCLQFPIPTQCILSKTLRNPKSLRTIIYKIAVQILCKIGGSPWALQFPCQNWMVIGIDVYHCGTGSSKQAVLGFVGSLNNTFTSWYSLAQMQRGEISAVLKACFAKTLEQYKNCWGRFPDKIVVFRDGVGDGQMDHCKNFEVPQFEEIIKSFELNSLLTFVVVKKRINTRIYTSDNGCYNNPAPGTIVDTTITRKYLFDFFLVPQHVNQGTVTPTHYVVISNNANIKPDALQKLSFKMCHLYYNWSGTIRVPAPCQYAHKLAYLVGNFVGKEPSEELRTKLFYL